MTKEAYAKADFEESLLVLFEKETRAAEGLDRPGEDDDAADPGKGLVAFVRVGDAEVDENGSWIGVHD